MTACGQTSTHLPHWMQMFSSQTGISWAMFRFSHRVVPAGQVPSAGRALTGSRSPSPAIIRAVTLRTNSGASAGDDRRPVGDGGRRPSGTSTSCRCASAASTAAQFFSTTAWPRLP